MRPPKAPWLPLLAAAVVAVCLPHSAAQRPPRWDWFALQLAAGPAAETLLVGDVTADPAPAPAAEAPAPATEAPSFNPFLRAEPLPAMDLLAPMLEPHMVAATVAETPPAAATPAAEPAAQLNVLGDPCACSSTGGANTSGAQQGCAAGPRAGEPCCRRAPSPLSPPPHVTSCRLRAVAPRAGQRCVGLLGGGTVPLLSGCDPHIRP